MRRSDAASTNDGWLSRFPLSSTCGRRRFKTFELHAHEILCDAANGLSRVLTEHIAQQGFSDHCQ